MRLIALATCMLALLCVFDAAPAWAANAPAPDGTCTTDPQFNPAPPAPGDGILSRITENVRNVLSGLSRGIFRFIVNNSGFRQMLMATLTLYIAVYGILFTFAMVQASLFDFATRCIKIGIVVGLTTSSAWTFFNDIVVTFFNDGTDYLIYELSQIAVSGISQPIPPGSQPFVVIDSVIHQALSAKMAVTMLAAFFTGPYGLLFGLLILMSLGTFMRALLVAVWVYLMSLVIKTFLFGIAPIFLICILFNRTRHLFQGWLNQVLNASLQPIFLFAFFAFFAKLVEAALGNILQVPVCWTETMESVRGTPFNMHYWRFTHNSEPFGGLWSWTGAETSGAPVFPIDIMDVLIFLIIAELASRFNSVVLMIARDIANATTSLAAMEGSLGNFMGNKASAQGRKGGAPGDLGQTDTTRRAGYGGSGSVARAGGAYQAEGAAAGAGGGATGSVQQANANAGSNMLTR